MFNSRHGAILGLFSLARCHAGFSRMNNPRKQVINRFVDWAYSFAYTSPVMIHDAYRGHELLEAMGLPPGEPACEVWFNAADLQFAKDTLQPRVGKDDILVALGVGASMWRRRWPPERFHEVCSWMLSQWPNIRFVCMGDKEDQAAAEKIGLQDRLINLAGTCSINKSAALLSLCQMFIGTDSGPTHMAAAVGLDIVVLGCHPLGGMDYHAASPKRYAPFGVKSVVLQPPVFRAPCKFDSCSSLDPHCLLEVTPGMVKKGIVELFADRLNSSAVPPQLERT